MTVSPAFRIFSMVVLANVFLVIIAGGVVRMTQSGMGCPDWPKCFGQWIPPTHESQLPANYKEIYKFKYVDTSFNVYHTWIEYINRLCGALLGVMLFIQFLWSLKYRKIKPVITWMSLVLLLLTGFEGWLGNKVVEANLEVAKVTTHMLVALVIAALAYHIIHLTKDVQERVVDNRLRWFSFILLVLVLLQIVLGTGIREQIDQISLGLAFEQREEWIGKLDNMFYVHRSFSLIVLAAFVYLFLKFRKHVFIRSAITWSVALVVLIILLGVVMNYLAMPAIAQPLHLVLSAVLVVVVYSIFLKSRSARQVLR
jgi:heme a synthase